MSTAPPDPYANLKERMRWMWSQGDYSRLALLLEPAAKTLAGLCTIRPGMRILDVAAGNGNFAVAAARLGADVTASDLTPGMLELGRSRSEAAGLSITWIEADAEELPFPAAAFDLVASVFGAMFAPRPERVTSELFRVVRPGGVVAMANYGSAGFLGRLAELMSHFSPPAPFDFPSPFLWGEREEVRRRFGSRASTIAIDTLQLRFGFDSFDEWLEVWEHTNPPLMALKQMLPQDAYQRLLGEAAAMIQELNQARDERVALDSAYVTVVATSPP